jgi:hypothetical protein
MVRSLFSRSNGARARRLGAFGDIQRLDLAQSGALREASSSTGNLVPGFYSGYLYRCDPSHVVTFVRSGWPGDFEPRRYCLSRSIQIAPWLSDDWISRAPASTFGISTAT